MKGQLIDDDMPAIPCGLVAKSFFNDTFVLERIDEDKGESEQIEIKISDIAWNSDIQYKFKNIQNVPKYRSLDPSDY